MKLKIPKNIRPTSGKVKEAIFSILQGYVDSFESLDCMDLFAGSGALGLKAIELGAKKCVFVENSTQGVWAIKQNIDKYHFEEKSKILKKDVLKFEFTENFDLIFADPPYALEKSKVEVLLQKVERVLKSKGIFVFEFNSKLDSFAFPESLELKQKKDYGDTVVWFFRRLSRH